VQTSPEELAAEFDRKRHTCLRISAENDFSGVSKGNQVTLVRDGDRLIVDALGDDPFVMLPVTDAPGTGSAIVKIDMDSREDAMIQLFYSRHGGGRYLEPHSIKQLISAGRQVGYFELAPMDLSGPLRLDTGATPGTLVIYSIEIRCD
jgi:hypothetical protein